MRKLLDLKISYGKKNKPTELCYLFNCDKIDCDECIITEKIESFKIILSYTEGGKIKTICVK